MKRVSAGFFGGPHDVDHVAFFKHLLGAGMKLQQVHVIGLEAFERAVDRQGQHHRVPIFHRRIEGFAGVAALGEEKEFVATVGEGVADELFGAFVALGGVDGVESGVRGLR